MSRRLAIIGWFVSSLSISAMTYNTNFPKAENPLSEGGKWKNGGTDGLDWTNCRTTVGMVVGTESGIGKGSTQYDDSTCLLSGTWGPLQTVQATVFSRNQSRVFFQEVEIRLRSTMSAHSSTGYEVLFRAYHPGGYATIVRWNGPLGKFTYLNQKPNDKYKGIQSGDVIKASIDKNGVIVGYVNDVEVIRAVDTTYASGNPGIGFWLEGKQGAGTNADYGFSAVTATDNVNSGAKAANFTASRTDMRFAALFGGMARLSRSGRRTQVADERPVGFIPLLGLIGGLCFAFRNMGRSEGLVEVAVPTGRKRQS